MRENWGEVKLKNIFFKVNGLWTGKKEPYVNVKVYTMTNFTKDSFLDKNKEPREIVASLSQFEKRRLEKGDILVEKSGGGPKQPVGRAVLFDIENNENNTFSNFTTRLRLNQNYKDKVYPNFVHHFLRLKYIAGETEKFQKNSTNIRNLQLDEYLEQSFSFPPLAEQQRIVSILDKAFATIDKAKANAEQNQKNAKELFDRALDQILYDKKWELKLLGEVCRKVEYGTSTKAQPQGKLPVLRMGNIQNGQFNWDSLVYSDNKEDNKKYFLKYNDVLFNRTNSPELVGKTAIYKGERPAIFAGYLIRVHRKEDLLDADYLNYYLNSKMAFEYGQSVVISSVNQANINGTKLKAYPIPLPSLHEQQTIVRQLDALRAETQKLEAVYQKKIDDLEELKKSILLKAFAGELKMKSLETA